MTVIRFGRLYPTLPQLGMTNPEPKSNCCGAPMKTHRADEGTCCFVCSGCQKACDPATQQSEMEKLLRGFEITCENTSPHSDISPPVQGGEIQVMLSYIRSLEKQVKELEEKLRVAVEALNEIASWSEGDVVDGGFDEPRSAYISREALSHISSPPIQ